MDFLDSDSGRLWIWGVFTRAFAIVLAIVLASFSYQLPSLSGRRGLSPLADILANYRRDFGVARSLWYWPTLFWLAGTSEVALAAVPACGALAALCAAWGGAVASPVGLAVAWATLLSVDAGPSACVYPWDSLALEAAFLAMWLPGTQPLSVGVASLAAPPPLLAFAFRWLLFRVLVGFGKLKFTGAGHNDRFYIRGFIIGQPMVTPAGWLAYHVLPDGAWVALVHGMFFIELIAPFGLFFTGIPRITSAALIVQLMMGIQLTGNFGYFNLLTAVLCIPGADIGATLALSDVVAPNGLVAAAFVALFTLYMLPVSLLQFVMNSWINMSWAHWSGVYRLRLPVWLWWSQFYARLLREVGHFRLVSAYGVFPPAASPAQRWALCFEGSADGKVWRRYELQYYINSPKTPPRFVAPWHPRIDHAIFYESFGGSGSPMAVLGHNNPYAFHVSANAWVRLQLRLLEGGDALRAVAPFFRVNPFPEPARPPRFVRVIACQYLPSPWKKWQQTGDWWTETVMGVTYAPLSLDSLRLAQLDPRAPLPKKLDYAWPLNDSAPMPEDFWCEFSSWINRAKLSSGVVTQQDLDDVWDFIADLREAAALSVLDLCAKKTHSSTKRSSSPARRGAAAMPTGASGSREAEKSGISEPVAVTHSRTYIRLPLSADTQAAAERVLACARSRREVSRADFDAVFVWSALPGTVARLRAGRSMAALTRMRSIINRISAPFQRAAARVFDRPTPSNSELESEIRRCRESISARAQASWPHVGDMVVGLKPDSSVSTARDDQPSSGGLFSFAGNDDANIAGCMQNPLQWRMHAHRVLLEGGREAWQHGVTTLLGAEGFPIGQRIPLGERGDALCRTPRPVVWDNLCVKGRFDPAEMATEAGSFLMWTLDFDTFSATATAFHRVASQSRPLRSRPAANPTFLPAMLNMVPRMHAHPSLRSAHSPHAALGCHGFLPSAVVPGWCLSDGESVWTPSGTLHQ